MAENSKSLWSTSHLITNFTIKIRSLNCYYPVMVSVVVQWTFGQHKISGFRGRPPWMMKCLPQITTFLFGGCCHMAGGGPTWLPLQTSWNSSLQIIHAVWRLHLIVPCHIIRSFLSTIFISVLSKQCTQQRVFKGFSHLEANRPKSPIWPFGFWQLKRRIFLPMQASPRWNVRSLQQNIGRIHWKSI